MKPILFNTEMVRAILDGRKSVTRRMVKRTPSNDEPSGYGFWKEFNERDKTWYIKDYTHSCTWWPEKEYLQRFGKYQVGDILYVRETWQETFEIEYTDFDSGREIKNIHDLITNFDEIDKKECGMSSGWAPPGIEKRMKYIVYKADNLKYSEEKYELRWHPSIHMPKEAARIFLKVTNVRVDRLQDISDKEAKREGIIAETNNSGLMHKLLFTKLWDSTVKKSDLDRYGWDANPFCWVIEFERISKEEAYGRSN